MASDDYKKILERMGKKGLIDSGTYLKQEEDILNERYKELDTLRSNLSTEVSKRFKKSKEKDFFVDRMKLQLTTSGFL